MKKAAKFENSPINIKIKLAGIWVTLMLLYIYADFFSLMVPGRVMGFNDGEMGLGTTTPTKLFLVSILMAIPALMVFLSLMLSAKINRLLNIVFGSFYTLIMILTINSTIGDPWMTFYIFFGIIEIIISSIIVWQAWKWPKEEA